MNRSTFLDRLEASIATGTTAPVVLFCDLNGFKAINDGLGHLAGDELLRQVAVRLRSAIRDGDTLARYGGDEFVILCPRLDEPTIVCDRIDRALRAPVDIDGAPVLIHIRIGAVVAAAGLDADAVLHNADQAMYQVKRSRDATAHSPVNPPSRPRVRLSVA